MSAAAFWSRAKQERQALQAEFARKATAQMLTAGALDPESLTPQARRTLAWLAESDHPTVQGVADLLTAAHDAGQRAERTRRHDGPVTSLSDGLAAPPTPDAGPGSSGCGPASPITDDRPASWASEKPDAHGGHPPDRSGAGRRTRGRPEHPSSQPVDPMAGPLRNAARRSSDRAADRPNAQSRHSADRLAARLAALSQAADDRTVEL